MSITSHIVRTLFTIWDLKRDLGWVPPTNVEAVENVSYGSCDKWHLLDDRGLVDATYHRIHKIHFQQLRHWLLEPNPSLVLSPQS